jgi:hypothetical protein
MTLWSLNGGDEPDNADVGSQYRFAHEYLVQAGVFVAVLRVCVRVSEWVRELVREWVSMVEVVCECEWVCV